MTSAERGRTAFPFDRSIAVATFPSVPGRPVTRCQGGGGRSPAASRWRRGRAGLSRAETIREAVRRWAWEMVGEEDRVLALVGSIDDPEVPADLSTRHDEYAVTGHPNATAESGRGRPE